MKLNLKIVSLLYSIVLFSGIGLSQVAYECTINQVINGSNLEVSVYIRSTGATTFKLGGANFRMNSDTSALDISSMPNEVAEGMWDDENDPINYGDQGIGRNENQGWVSVDIFGEATFDGVIVPSTDTLVGAINIPITNTSLNSEIAWRVSGLNKVEIIDTDLNDVTSNGTFIDPGLFPLSTTTTFQLTVTVTNGWNMVSIPGLHPTNQDVDTWWSGLTGNVFKFSGSYQVVTAATPTEGYWMKHTGDTTYNTGDEWPAGGIEIVPNDPISATAGWNMIGGYENSAAVGGLTTTPPGLISGSVFGYSGSSGYVPATSLIPGYGYWIKLTGDGVINILPVPLGKGSTEVVEYFKDDWGKIIITDNAGRSYTLYAVKGEVDLNLYELPPMPPAGMFDIRFGSGRIAEDINSSIQSIEMGGLEYPITVKVENMDIRLQDESGKDINENVKSGDQITISDVSINKLMVSTELIPDKYVLYQNYPNPFNPSTTIKFALPQDSKVKLTVFNILGEKVVQLADQEIKAGYHQIEFNASHYASGVYFYRIEAGSFIDVKKMVLLK